ncbi:MAG: hypothetical protein ACTSUE_19880 [Promethearchaeota archaeon]
MNFISDSNTLQVLERINTGNLSVIEVILETVGDGHSINDKLARSIKHIREARESFELEKYEQVIESCLKSNEAMPNPLAEIFMIEAMILESKFDEALAEISTTAGKRPVLVPILEIFLIVTCILTDKPGCISEETWLTILDPSSSGTIITYDFDRVFTQLHWYFRQLGIKGQKLLYPRAKELSEWRLEYFFANDEKDTRKFMIRFLKHWFPKKFGILIIRFLEYCNSGDARHLLHELTISLPDWFYPHHYEEIGKDREDRHEKNGEGDEYVEYMYPIGDLVSLLDNHRLLKEFLFGIRGDDQRNLRWGDDNYLLVSNDLYNWHICKDGNFKNFPPKFFDVLLGSKDHRMRQLLAMIPGTPEGILEKFLQDKDVKIVKATIRNKSTTPELLERFVKNSTYYPSFDMDVPYGEYKERNLLALVAKRDDITANTFEIFASSKDDRLRSAVAGNPGAPPSLLRRLFREDRNGVSYNLSRNPKLPRDVVDVLSRDEDERIRVAIAMNPATPDSILKAMVRDDGEESVRKNASRNLEGRIKKRG